MAVLPILQKGEPMLRMAALPLEPEDLPEHFKLVDDMVDTVLDANGIGLAAPQVGRRTRLIVIRPPGGRPMAIANPVIVTKSTPRRFQFCEGCLSIPRKEWPEPTAQGFSVVPRSKIVRISYLARDGSIRLATFSGMSAIILQHEIDHLNGVLFTDRVK